MKREDFGEHFRTLEVDLSASFQDVRRAYHHLKELFSSRSIVLDPVVDELDPPTRENLIQELDHAYKELCFYFNEKASEEKLSGNPEPSRVTPPPSEGYSGPALKEIREMADVRLSDISLATRIRLEYLENIEKENYAALPPPVFLRGYVASYATYLSLDPILVTRDFMKRYEKTQG